MSTPWRVFFIRRQKRPLENRVFCVFREAVHQECFCYRRALCHAANIEADMQALKMLACVSDPFAVVLQLIFRSFCFCARPFLGGLAGSQSLVPASATTIAGSCCWDWFALRSEMPLDLALALSAGGTPDRAGTSSSGGEGKAQSEGGAEAAASGGGVAFVQVGEYIRGQGFGFALLLLQLLHPLSSLFHAERDLQAHLLRHRLMRGPQTHSSVQELASRSCLQSQQQTQSLDELLQEASLEGMDEGMDEGATWCRVRTVGFSEVWFGLQVGEYKSGLAMDPGRFSLKTNQWRHFDPHCVFYSWAEFQDCESRFLELLDRGAFSIQDWLPPQPLSPPLPALYAESFFGFATSSAVRAVASLLVFQQLFLQLADGRYLHLTLGLLLRLLALHFQAQSELSQEALARLRSKEARRDALRFFASQNPETAKRLIRAARVSGLEFAFKQEEDVDVEEAFVVCAEMGLVAICPSVFDFVSASAWQGLDVASSLLRVFEFRHCWLEIDGREEFALAADDANPRLERLRLEAARSDCEFIGDGVKLPYLEETAEGARQLLGERSGFSSGLAAREEGRPRRTPKHEAEGRTQSADGVSSFCRNLDSEGTDDSEADTNEDKGKGDSLQGRSDQELLRWLKRRQRFYSAWPLSRLGAQMIFEALPEETRTLPGARRPLLVLNAEEEGVLYDATQDVLAGAARGDRLQELRLLGSADPIQLGLDAFEKVRGRRVKEASCGGEREASENDASQHPAFWMYSQVVRPVPATEDAAEVEAPCRRRRRRRTTSRRPQEGSEKAISSGHRTRRHSAEAGRRSATSSSLRTSRRTNSSGARRGRQDLPPPAAVGGSDGEREEAADAEANAEARETQARRVGPWRVWRGLPSSSAFGEGSWDFTFVSGAWPFRLGVRRANAFANRSDDNASRNAASASAGNEALAEEELPTAETVQRRRELLRRGRAFERRKAPPHFPFVVRCSLLQVGLLLLRLLTYPLSRTVAATTRPLGRWRRSAPQVLYGMRKSERFKTHWRQLEWVLDSAAKIPTVAERLRIWKEGAAKLRQQRTAVETAASSSSASACRPVSASPSSSSVVVRGLGALQKKDDDEKARSQGSLQQREGGVGEAELEEERSRLWKEVRCAEKGAVARPCLSLPLPTTRPFPT